MGSGEGVVAVAVAVAGREGDWECSGCRNRNYAFRSFCNRCKQPRLLVDNITPSDSKWLPRIGDWICTGCTNNNYASREKCKKCGQPKEVAAMPAVAIPGAPLPTHPTYFSRPQGGVEQLGNVGEADRYGFQPTSSWHLGGNSMSAFPFAAQSNQFPSVPNGNGWRNGDWMCVCGFHNYSSRAQCKKCNAPTPIVTSSSLASAAVTALGIKRMASEEIPHWDNKRLNAGQQPYPGYESFPNHGGNQLNGIYPTIPNGSTGVPPNFQVNLQMMRAPVTPILLGKGAKQWRDGDWMCSNCNNHNYASRASCNRCKSQREALDQPLSVS